MKIRITDIPANGLKINDTIPLNALNHRMQQGTKTDIVFTSDPKVTLEVRRTPNGAETLGTVSVMVKQPCSRCSEEKEREIETRADFILQQLNPRDIKVDSEGVEQDVGIVYFEGEHVDLEPTLQECLILELSLFWHPPTTKDGKCRECGLGERRAGTDKEEGKVKFADLLKKAGVN